MNKNMICPYRSEGKDTLIIHNKDRSKTRVQVVYTPQPCLRNLCPFYSDGTGEYIPDVCIKVAKDLED